MLLAARLVERTGQDLTPDRLTPDRISGIQLFIKVNYEINAIPGNKLPIYY